jgi:predicted DsbA family dithiol-disulfide isomerase
MRIDIVTEITCPWCMIALHRLDKVLARDFPDIEVEFVHHPLLLTADFPDEGYDPREQLKTRYGITDAEAAWARPEAEARASGIPLDLSKQPRLHRTDRAHVLIRNARERGTQHALALAITDAFFFNGQDINDPDVLARIDRGEGHVRHRGHHQRDAACRHQHRHDQSPIGTADTDRDQQKISDRCQEEAEHHEPARAQGV